MKMNNANSKNALMKSSAIIAMVLLVSACADAPPKEVISAIETYCTDPYGFWGGLWHGLTSFLHFIGSLLDDDIDFFARCNNGGWYSLGYILGISGLSSAATVNHNMRRW